MDDDAADLEAVVSSVACWNIISLCGDQICSKLKQSKSIAASDQKNATKVVLLYSFLTRSVLQVFTNNILSQGSGRILWQDFCSAEEK